MRKIKALFFDLDGTLWDFRKNSEEVLIDILERHDVPIAYDEFLHVYAPINQKLWRRYRFREINPRELNYERFHQTFKALKLNRSKTWIGEFRDSYIAGLGDPAKLYPHTRETLEYLRERYSLHVITDGFSELQKNKLKRTGIFSYFDTLTFSDEAGATKPSPLIFKTALSRAEVAPEQSLMIGDHPEFDVQGARKSGLQAIHFVPDADIASEENGRISSIFELTKIL